MCGRYVSRLDAAMERAWSLSGPPPRFESYNVAPTQRVPLVREADGQRCLLPANGFYEWQVRDSGKQPFYIHLTDQPLFGLAGIHNARARMPAILRHADHDAWLHGDLASAMHCLAPYPGERMRAYPVSTAVNSPRNNEPRLIEALRLAGKDGG